MATSTQAPPPGPYQPLPPPAGATGKAQYPIVAQRTPLQRNIATLWLQARKTLRGQFIVSAIGILIASLIVGLIVMQAFSKAYNDLQTIARDSVPSVDAAQAMSQYIEDIDAKTADYLAAASLTARTPCSIIGSSRNPGNLTDHDCDAINISAELILANQQLYIAIHNVTYPGEHTATERIAAGFEEYNADVAIEEHEYALAVNKTDPRDPHLLLARAAYTAATNVLNLRITKQPTLDANGNPVYDEPNIPSCVLEGRTIAAKDWPLGSLQQNIDCLSSINKGYLDRAYDDTISSLSITIVLIGILCLAYCGLLAFILLRMVRFSHRIINIGLALALLISLGFSIATMYSFISMSGRHGSFGVMTKDAYDSVYYAALLKRYGTAANADESRWLIAVDFGDQAEINRWQQDWYTNRAHVNTLIKQAVGNRTWPQEDQPLANMQSHWQTYTSIDPQIRALARDTANPNRIHDAQALSTGKSNDNFFAFTDAVDHLTTVNRSYFTSTYTTMNTNLNLLIPLSIILFLLTGLLSVWGISQRLKDF